eukprot:684545-Amphidinium_carterae.1
MHSSSYLVRIIPLHWRSTPPFCHVVKALWPMDLCLCASFATSFALASVRWGGGEYLEEGVEQQTKGAQE